MILYLFRSIRYALRLRSLAICFIIFLPCPSGHANPTSNHTLDPSRHYIHKTMPRLALRHYFITHVLICATFNSRPIKCFWEIHKNAVRSLPAVAPAKVIAIGLGIQTGGRFKKKTKTVTSNAWNYELSINRIITPAKKYDEKVFERAFFMKLFWTDFCTCDMTEKKIANNPWFFVLFFFFLLNEFLTRFFMVPFSLP